MDEDATVRPCPVCGTSYAADPGRLKWGRQTTCSRRCSYAARGKAKELKTRVACVTCGRETERSPSHVKGKYGGSFCSRACHYAGRSLGLSGRTVTKPYVISEAARKAWLVGAAKTVVKRRAGDNYFKSEDTRAKLSIATARIIAKGKPGTSSKFEDKVASHLEVFGTPFVRQFAFRDGGGRFAFVVDFWFPETGSVIEANGTYWHADPRVYPVPVNATQSRCLARYRRKLNSLGAAGIRVAEVWEMDFKSDPAKAVLKAYAVATGS